MSPSRPIMPLPRAKKSLGQHFLRHPQIAERIVALLGPAPEDNIIEIGPGPGALTHILERAPHSRLLLLEKDRHYAAERQRRAAPHTQTVLTDALTFAWARISPANPWKIIGNLPYNIASPLIWDILAQASGLARGVFMVQKEVAQRLAAAPGGRIYGALSAWVQSFAKVDIAFYVGPGAFSPPPKVDSAVIVASPLPPQARPTAPATLARLLHVCFQQRRKQIGTILRQHGNAAWLANAARYDLSRRPETLSPAEFQAIAVDV